MSENSKKRRRIAMFGMQRHRMQHPGRAEDNGILRTRISNTSGYPEAVTVPEDQAYDRDIVCAGTVMVKGSVVGDINANRIVVGASASVNGTLKARTIHIDGSVRGSVDCGRISIGPSAEIIGNVVYDTLSIANGASVSGHCQDRAQSPAKSTIAYLTKPTRIDEPALPFSAAKAAFRKSPSPLRQSVIAPRQIAGQTGSMRAIWNSYQRNRARP